MLRQPSEEEKKLVLRLIGPEFEEIEIIKEQLDACQIDDLYDPNILEFKPLISRRLTTTRTLIGEGSSRDVDDIPVIFSLLQKDGYLWRLDISRVDGQRIRDRLHYGAVVALGFAKGLSLEDRRCAGEK